MKTKTKSKNPKAVKLTDLKARKDPKGGSQTGRNSSHTSLGRGGYGNHNETFLAD